MNLASNKVIGIEWISKLATVALRDLRDKKALSALFYIHELTDAKDWFFSL